MSGHLIPREQLAQRLKQLPSLPTAVDELLRSFSSEDIDIDTVVRLLAKDQGLVARVLRVANSSFYGLQSKVGSIGDAVTVLGFKAVRSMVLAVGMSSVFKAAQCPGFDPSAYLRHGVATALAARNLARVCGQNPELAFTAGLLHDIGQLVLAANFSAAYSAALTHYTSQDCLLVEAERSVLGIDHAEAGGLLASHWRFPDTLRDAVTHHHDPATAPADSLADVVHLADITAHALGLSGARDERVPRLDRRAWLRAGLSEADYSAILPHVVADFETTCHALAG